MIFLSFHYYNFEDTITKNWSKCLKFFFALLAVPVYSVVQTLIVT